MVAWEPRQAAVHSCTAQGKNKGRLKKPEKNTCYTNAPPEAAAENSTQSESNATFNSGCACTCAGASVRGLRAVANMGLSVIEDNDTGHEEP